MATRYRKPRCTGNIGDVGTPDLIGPVYRQAFEQIRDISCVRGMRRAGSRRLINRLKSHQAHQTPNPVPANANAFALQVTDHLTAAVKRILQEQLVDVAHQRQVPGALTLRRVIERGSADREKATLAAQTQARVVATDHRLAFPPAHRLSPLAKKSRSTVSSPILA